MTSDTVTVISGIVLLLGIVLVHRILRRRWKSEPKAGDGDSARSA